MAPTNVKELVARFITNSNCYNDGFGGYYGDCDSAWYRWGRWVLLGCAVVFAILVVLAFSCLNGRRRRRRGLQPRYGTGWLAGKTPEGHNGPSYTGYNNAGFNGGYNQPNYNPAPPYSPPPVNQQSTGNTFNSNEGYYGQQNGIELQQPQNAYAPPRGGDPVYAPPQGPPPKAKYGDGVTP
ncbi:MAG: hypothetical protein M1818_004906 [Claussenomyces sp. TS43310]|nr:MAG: hypothetical protein M1818_004906 [Claussenomyces sp. TS43310]